MYYVQVQSGWTVHKYSEPYVLCHNKGTYALSYPGVYWFRIDLTSEVSDEITPDMYCIIKYFL